MPHYKDRAGNAHFIDDEKFQDLLPEGSSRISDEEAKTLSEISIVLPREDVEKQIVMEAIALRSQYEIQGTADPLTEATEWYNSRLAELDLIYG